MASVKETITSRIEFVGEDGEKYVRETGITHCPPFDRIRRITGYLVGTTDRFGDGKKAEEKDRVKHSMGFVRNIRVLTNEEQNKLDAIDKFNDKLMRNYN